MKKVIFSLFFILSSSSLFSQQSRVIKGKVIDTYGNPIEFASAVVVNDSLNIRFGADSDSLGRYKFSAREGRYLFEISLLGYKKFQSEIVIDADKVMPDVVMELVSEKIKGATIVESRVDHNVSGYKLNVKNKKYMQQMDLVEIFATAPGLFIGDDVKIYGKSVQTVYIDRRKVKMTGAELVNYLKMYQGKNIDNIEVIINSGLDEIGTGGAIIKISTIKDKGGFGSISNRFLFNAHKLVESPSININHRIGKLSLYLNSSYMTMKLDRENTTLYQWDKVDANATSINKNNLRLPNSLNNVMGFGYDISKNDFISFEISYQHLIRNTLSDYAYEKVVGGIASDESYKRGVENKNTINNYAATLMYVHTFKDKSELEIKGDYYGQDVTKRLIDTIPEIYESNWRKSIKDNNNSDSYLFSAKYSKSFFGRKDKFLSGIYYSNINQTIANITDNIIVKIRTYSESTFDYSEDIVYGYSSYSYNFNKFSLRGGLRGEFSNINNSNYFNVIPEITAAWFMNKQKGNILRANYRRNISRPNITHLNTNPIITEDASIINIGNKDLLPYLSNTYSLDFILNNNYMLRVAHSHADDMQTSYMYYDNNNLIYRTYINGLPRIRMELVWMFLICHQTLSL
jgi:hypothetical protein